MRRLHELHFARPGLAGEGDFGRRSDQDVDAVHQELLVGGAGFDHGSTPFEISVPPLQTFTFVQVTGRVIARTISATGNDQPSQSLPSVPSSPPAKKAKTAAKSGPGSSTGDEPPAIKTKGKIVVAGDEAEFDEAELDDEEGGSEEDDEAALARLQGAASAKKPKGRPVGGGKPAKKRAKPN